MTAALLWGLWGQAGPCSVPTAGCGRANLPWFCQDGRQLAAGVRWAMISFPRNLLSLCPGGHPVHRERASSESGSLCLLGWAEKMEHPQNSSGWACRLQKCNILSTAPSSAISAERASRALRAFPACSLQWLHEDVPEPSPSACPEPGIFTLLLSSFSKWDYKL